MRSVLLRFVSTALALSWTACSSATPVGQGEPAALPTGASSSTSQARTSSPRPSATAPAQKLAASEAWQWLRATLPEETAKLRLDESRANIDKLLSWAPGEAATVVFDRACRKLALTRNERTLDGAVHEQTTIVGNSKTVHRDSISFGFDITVVCGSDTSYEHGPGGAWVESGTSASGCFHSIGHHISDVRDGQVWYAAEQVTLKIGCASHSEQEQRCTDGTTRTCKTCSAVLLDVKPERGMQQQGSAHVTYGARRGPAPLVDCSTPCPVDELTPMIEAASAALADTAFEQLGHDAHPTLFRDRTACTAYRQKHSIAKDQIDVW